MYLSNYKTKQLDRLSKVGLLQDSRCDDRVSERLPYMYELLLVLFKYICDIVLGI